MVCVCVGVGIDFIQFERTIDKAGFAVDGLGGEMTSLGGWPLGQETYVIFDRPLTADEIARLKCLRHIRGTQAIGFRCEMTPEKLHEIREAIPNVWVGDIRHPDDR